MEYKKVMTSEEQQVNDLLTGQFGIKRTIVNEIADLEELNATQGITPERKQSITEAKVRLKAVEESIADLTVQIQKYKKDLLKEARDEEELTEQELVKKLIDEFHIGYIPKNNEFVYCVDLAQKGCDIINPVFFECSAANFGGVLNKMAGRILKFSEPDNKRKLTAYFNMLQKDYLTTTASFNLKKWEKGIYNKSTVIRDFWIQPNFVDHENYDKRFDFLMRCVGGDKQENIDWLETFVGYKWCYPERSGNTPNPDIGGNPGGNGKGRFVELFRTIFTSQCIRQAVRKELEDGFNSGWELAVLVFYDEPAEKELPENKIKQATGGEEMRSERKGVDATIVDRNYNFLFISNNQNGVVKLAGTGSGGEDRRFSVMVTELVMLDEAMKLGLNEDDAKVYVNDINELIKNREEVRKWLAHIILKHDVANMKVLHPLHGEDYKARFEDQKKDNVKVFDLLLPIFKQQGCIPSRLIRNLVIAMNDVNEDRYSTRACNQEWKLYCAKNKVHNIVYEEKVRIKHLYDGQLAYEEAGYGIFKISREDRNAFDYKEVLKGPPSKESPIIASKIILGMDLDNVASNVVALDPNRKLEGLSKVQDILNRAEKLKNLRRNDD